jgi:hypothetical protein
MRSWPSHALDHALPVNLDTEFSTALRFEDFFEEIYQVFLLNPLHVIDEDLIFVKGNIAAFDFWPLEGSLLLKCLNVLVDLIDLKRI